MKLAAVHWVLATLCLWGCQRDRIGSVDSESHWMSVCTVDAECGGTLSCVCGICTTPCADDACGALGGLCSAGPLCAAAAAPACVPNCADGCAEDHLECVAGACVPRVDAGPMGDRGVPDRGVDGGGMDRGLDQGPGPDGGPEQDAMVERDGEVTEDAEGMTGDAGPELDEGPRMDRGVDEGVDQGPDMMPPLGECAHPDSACQADVQCGGNACSALYPTDPCVCLPRPAVPTVVPCVEGCCGGDCGDELCQGVGIDAQDQRCGDIPEPADNVCVAERCTHDVECGIGMTCIRPGEWGHVRSACVIARCQRDADCDAAPGGRCLGFFRPCYVRGFACAYPNDPCRVDGDCDDRGGPRVCLPLEGGGTECAPVP